MRNDLKPLQNWLLLLAVVLLLVFCGCESLTGGPYKILTLKGDKTEVAAGESMSMTISVGRTGRPQVQHTDTIDVVVTPSDARLKVSPKIVSFEEITGENSVRIVLRPGSTLPREFVFDVQVPGGMPAGEYHLKVSMKANNESDESSLTLKVP